MKTGCRPAAGDGTGALAVLGIGTALPPYRISQADAVQMAASFRQRSDREADLLPILFRRAGVRTRHLAVLEGERILPFYPAATGPTDHGPSTAERMARYEREALPLAARACRQALDRAGLIPRDVTHLVTVSCTGFAAPGLDVRLIADLALPRTTRRVHIGFMGCHGALNALEVARALAAEPEARVLICAVELCSLHFRYNWAPEQSVANALFADGAAALVGGSAATVPGGTWRAAAAGSCLLPESETDMTWRIGDHGFEMGLSPRVPDVLRSRLRPWLETWLSEHGLRLEEVGSWAVHPGGPRILTAVEQALGLSETALAASRDVLAECGNMSSPTVLFILDRLRARSAALPCVALGFGPGLVAEAVLFW